MQTGNMCPLFLDKVNQLLKIANGQGLSVDIFSDYRSMEEQARLYSLGRTLKNLDGYNSETKPLGNIVTNAKPGYSAHNWGLAVDVVFKINKNWDWGSRNNWNKVGQIGESLGLEWGGRFKSIPDLPHFQLMAGLTFKEAIEIEERSDVWDEVEKRLKQNARA